MTKWRVPMEFVYRGFVIVEGRDAGDAALAAMDDNEWLDQDANSLFDYTSTDDPEEVK